MTVGMRFVGKLPYGGNGGGGISADVVNGRLVVTPDLGSLMVETAPAGERNLWAYNPVQNSYSTVSATALGVIALYTPAGTGAVSRVLQTWMRERNYTSDRAVTGNGSAGDATALQQSLTRLDAGNGGKLETTVPGTRYLIDAPLTISGNYPIDWDGLGQPELRTSYAGVAITIGSGPSTHQAFISIRNHKITGQGSSVTGIKGNFCANLKLENLNVADLGSLGVYLDNCYTFRLDKSQFFNNGGAGAYITGASMNGSSITRCEFIGHDGSNDAGINIDGSVSTHFGGLIQACDFEMNFFGVVLNNISGLKIDACYFEENLAHIYCAAASNVKNLTISNGEFLGPGYIELNDVDSPILENLTLYGTGNKITLTGCTRIKARGIRLPDGGTIVRDGVTITVAQLENNSYTVATLPSASIAGAGAQIFVSNETGGAVTAFSDGTNWRRVTDRAIVS